MSSDDDDETKEFIPNPVELDGVPDLSMLVYLEMEHVLHNLEHRYVKMARKHCYTSVSTVLIAINPYERLPIYGQDVIDEFHEAAKQGRVLQGRPHPYGVSARSYMRMIQRKHNQSIVVCGESGAGKTETTKLLMRYLAMTAPSSTMESSMVEQQIIAASPILEAYGNAKTLLNNNSSRFGKFTKLLYDVPKNSREGSILGSWLETYLLEKSRVVKQAKNERNYHIWYFLFAGLPEAQKEHLQLEHCSTFTYLNQGDACEVAGINDVDRYEELTDSMTLMRIDKGLQDQLWDLTVGLAHLGNVVFKREGDGFCKVSPKSSKSIAATARLWGISEAALVARLETANMKVMKKTIETKVNFDDAETNRDSITKSLYENTFLWLCSRINAELYQTDTEENIENLLFIGILDVFGFENFDNNSLEQFCINFTNEKLQEFFNHHIILSEQEEYIKESVFWTPLTVPDNREAVHMIELKSTGFFALLDSTCMAPQPTTEAFLQDLFNRHGENSRIHLATDPTGGLKGKGKKKKKKKKGKGRFSGFVLNHFADDVVYNIEMFLIKNMEAIHPDTAKMMKKSESPLIQQIGGGSGKKKKKKKTTVTGVFHKALSTLMKNLRQTEPYFVRCVNPNKLKSSKHWHVDIVEHQLRCGGLVQALKVLKLGYPTRVPYSTLYDKYHSSATNPLIQNMGPESFSTAILIAFDVNEDDYELGLTKIFFKPAKAAILDTIMAKAGQPLSAEQNKKITHWVVRKRIRQSIGMSKAFLELRMRVRLARSAKLWQHVGRVGSICANSVVRSLVEARNRISERKRNEAALMLQSFFRGNYELLRYRKRIKKCHKAVKILWKSYRRWDERAKLNSWLSVKVAETEKRLEEEARARREAEANMAAEERRAKQQQEATERRLAAQKAKQEAEEKRRIAEQEAAEKRQRDQEAAEAAKLEQQRQEALARQKAAQEQAEAERLEQEQMARMEERQARDNSIKVHKKKRRDEERTRRERRERKHMKKTMPELDDDDEDSGSYETDSDYDDAPPSVSQQLRNFDKVAATGQLFLKYTGKRRRKPQDRIVKISFDDDGNAKQVSWGSGSRHIDFSDIMYIAHGHYTPVFLARKDQLDEKLCFSVVGRTQILDISAVSPHIAELWVKGLRKLLGQSDEDAEKLSKEGLKTGNMPGGTSKVKERGVVKEHKKRTKSLMLLQQDLFVMTTTTVFRALEEERIWDIDQSVRDHFNAKFMYEQALRQDIPWRSWNTWIRSEIVTYLRDNGRVSHPVQPEYVAPIVGVSTGGGAARAASGSMSFTRNASQSRLGGVNRTSRVSRASRQPDPNARHAYPVRTGGAPPNGGSAAGGGGAPANGDSDEQCVVM